jgi:predicted O-methyltransferase YrrM
MIEIPHLVRRVIRRAGRIKPLERPSVRAEDGLEEALFFLDARWRSAGLADFRKLSSIKDHFDFSAKFFGVHQIESEIRGLLDWVKPMAPRRVCEIGMAMGGTTFLLGQSLPSVEHLVGVDIVVRHKRRLRYFSRPQQRLAFLEGSSYAPETVERMRAELLGQQLDLLFIDGDHSFDGVAKDFALYRQFVKPGGIIVFHDIADDYKTRYGRDTGRWAGEVPRFWRALKPSYQTREFVESPDQDGLGIGAIVYDPSVTPPALP